MIVSVAMRIVAIVAIALFTFACGGGKKSETPAPAPEMTPAEGCLQLFQRQRECTDVFIPALVALRVELDVPTGVAAEDASAGRDALVAKAKEEWAAGNSDAQLAELCGKLVAGIPPEQLDGMMAQGKTCVAAETCEAFTTCVEPMQRERLQAQKAGEGGAPPE